MCFDMLRLFATLLTVWGITGLSVPALAQNYQPSRYFLPFQKEKLRHSGEWLIARGHEECVVILTPSNSRDGFRVDKGRRCDIVFVRDKVTWLSSPTLDAFFLYGEKGSSNYLFVKRSKDMVYVGARDASVTARMLRGPTFLEKIKSYF